MDAPSIGVDIEDVDVWEALLPSKRWRWFSPLFAAEELAYGLQQPCPAASLGGVFAAKEAVIKALWPALELTPRQIAIIHEAGRPAARIDHPASRQWACDVSIAHSRLSVVAVCLARRLEA
jgi:holo-[acyl-carrier protein] synthase